MAPRVYEYVGPDPVRLASASSPSGTAITSREDLDAWLRSNPDAASEGATFIVDTAGTLLLAARRSEHVACARGRAVLAAGEIVFGRLRGLLEAVEVTNQSTGYCPEPDSYEVVENALRALGVSAPTAYTRSFDFRLCPACAQLNLVKDGWFHCEICGAELPQDWNLVREP